MERAYGTREVPRSTPHCCCPYWFTAMPLAFSSCRLENATYSIAFRFMAVDEHPDHDTLNTFCKLFLKEIEGLMVQILMIARTLGVLNLGKVNASRHNALELWAHQETGRTTARQGQDAYGAG